MPEENNDARRGSPLGPALFVAPFPTPDVSLISLFFPRTFRRQVVFDNVVVNGVGKKAPWGTGCVLPKYWYCYIPSTRRALPYYSPSTALASLVLVLRR